MLEMHRRSQFHNGPRISRTPSAFPRRMQDRAAAYVCIPSVQEQHKASAYADRILHTPVVILSPFLSLELGSFLRLWIILPAGPLLINSLTFLNNEALDYFRFPLRAYSCHP